MQEENLLSQRRLQVEVSQRWSVKSARNGRNAAREALEPLNFN